jgi:CheY-like chemotaxis protein
MATILLIDDDELLRDTVRQLLQRDGHQVTEAEDGEQGLSRFEVGRFHAVITDVLMPRVDGAQVIAELRRRAPTLPIVAISGGRRVLSPAFNLQTASLMGADVQLAKPFGRVELREALNKALQRGAVT